MVPALPEYKSQSQQLATLGTQPPLLAQTLLHTAARSSQLPFLQEAPVWILFLHRQSVVGVQSPTTVQVIAAGASAPPFGASSEASLLSAPHAAHKTIEISANVFMNRQQSNRHARTCTVFRADAHAALSLLAVGATRVSNNWQSSTEVAQWRRRSIACTQRPVVGRLKATRSYQYI